MTTQNISNPVYDEIQYIKTYAQNAHNKSQIDTFAFIKPTRKWAGQDGITSIPTAYDTVFNESQTQVLESVIT